MVMDLLIDWLWLFAVRKKNIDDLIKAYLGLNGHETLLLLSSLYHFFVLFIREKIKKYLRNRRR